MSLIDKLEDLVVKVDTEYQEKMEAVIREIVPGMPERERLAFCSWCCCHGGCNLCADISKYNIKGLKIYGG